MTGARPDLRALVASGPVHFMGVGGAGMAPLAELLLRSGKEVSGCDTRDSRALRDLEGLGGRVSVGHHAEHVREASALVVTAVVTTLAMPVLLRWVLRASAAPEKSR